MNKDIETKVDGNNIYFNSSLFSPLENYRIKENSLRRFK